MSPPSYGDETPIAALATPPGESALAVIRISGKSAINLMTPFFSRPGVLQKAPGHSLVYGWMINPAGERIDEVLVAVYRAPKSYTGEEGADISCHGGAAVVKGIMDILKAAGFRNALPGEFTFRAFMTGKLDLTRSESVMELVSARTDRSRERAVHRLSGALEGEIREIKALLLQVLAGTELFLDYSEEDLPASRSGDGSFDGGGPEADEALGRLPDRALAEEALERLRVLAASYRMERLYHEGALTVIAGRPNAGKSSLFNRLLKEDRSIVTGLPGTTRDWIEAWVSIRGIPIRLADTAGLHASDDAVERLGMERSRELLREADLILYVIDGEAGITGEDRGFFRDFGGSRVPAGKPPEVSAPVPLIPLWNKADAAPAPEASCTGKARGTGEALPPGETPFPAVNFLPVSAKTGAGIPVLTEAIAAALESAAAGESSGGSPGMAVPKPSPGIATARQKELIDEAVQNLAEALALADRTGPLDLIAPLIREGINALGEITGELSTADILETMFSRFCVGK
jgi:tRNA modification GTPase